MRPPRPNPYRDAWAGELDTSRAGETVRVAGWVQRRRDLGGLVFIDLRDRSGILQVVFHPEDSPEAHDLAQRLRSEHVITVAGEVVRREEGTVNPKIPTGEIELSARDVERLAESETPPFPLDDDSGVDEAIRLRHRMLDLRREPMRDAIDRPPHDHAGDARLPQRARLPRHRDADPHALHARGRARLPRPRPLQPGLRSTRCPSRRSCSSRC